MNGIKMHIGIGTGIYLGKVVKIHTENGHIPSGAQVWFELPEIDQIVKYYVKPVENDCAFSLKSLAYALDYPYDLGQRYFHRNLIGRFCRVHIKSINKNGKTVPVIKHFSFSQRQLFKTKGSGQNEGDNRASN